MGAVVVSIARLKMQLCQEFTYKKCILIVGFTRSLSYVSVGCLLLITLERYFKLIHSRIYHRYANKTYIVRGLLIHALCSFIMGLVVDTNWDMVLNEDINADIPFCTYAQVIHPTYGFINVLFVQIFLFIVIIIVYYLIIKFVKSKTIGGILGGQLPSTTSSRIRSMRRYRAEIKITVAAFSIVGCYLFFQLLLSI